MPELRLRTSWDDQTYVLHDGRADVSYIRLPVDQSGLQVQALLAEPRAAVFPASHRLAGKTRSASPTSLVSICCKIPPLCLNGATSPPRCGPGTAPASRLSAQSRRNSSTWPPVTASSCYRCRPRCSTPVPASPYSHVSDIAPNQVCLAWDATRRSRLIQDFAAIAADYPPVASAAEPCHRSPSGPPAAGTSR
jgi:DNA-binding transcriptional LysR family regulator